MGDNFINLAFFFISVERTTLRDGFVGGSAKEWKYKDIMSILLPHPQKGLYDMIEQW